VLGVVPTGAGTFPEEKSGNTNAGAGDASGGMTVSSRPGVIVSDPPDMGDGNAAEPAPGTTCGADGGAGNPDDPCEPGPGNGVTGGEMGGPPGTVVDGPVPWDGMIGGGIGGAGIAPGSPAPVAGEGVTGGGAGSPPGVPAPGTAADGAVPPGGGGPGNGSSVVSFAPGAGIDGAVKSAPGGRGNSGPGTPGIPVPELGPGGAPGDGLPMPGTDGNMDGSDVGPGSSPGIAVGGGDMLVLVDGPGLAADFGSVDPGGGGLNCCSLSRGSMLLVLNVRGGSALDDSFLLGSVAKDEL